MKRKTTMLAAALAVGAGAMGTAGLADGASDSDLKPAAYGLTAGGKLIMFDPTNTSRARIQGDVAGLAAGERLVGIDARPRSGEIYGLGDKGNVYEIDRETGGAATRTSLRSAGGAAVALQGTRFDIDFNPVNGLLRAVSDSGQNLRIDADTGVTTVDTALSYAGGGGSPRIVGAAYSNNDNDNDSGLPLTPPSRSTPTGTKLYTIDAGRRSLALQDPPNDGTLRTVGRLRKRTGGAVGFDIYTQADSEGNSRSNVAYASFNPGGRARLYKVSLRTGKAKRVRGGGGPFRSVVDIAFLP